MTALLLLVSFVLIVAGALLFTNAVEWLGRRLNLGAGAVGSILAAVGTALPESLIPLVALIGGSPGAEDVAIGSIIGAPFLLATLAMLLIGAAALAFSKRREHGREIRADPRGMRRDLVFFLVLFPAGMLLGIGVSFTVRVVAAVVLVVAYLAFVARTVQKGGGSDEGDLGPLLFDRGAGQEPKTWKIVVQLLVGLAAIVGGAELFVEEVVGIAEAFGVTPLVLSLILAPLATELPEKANSVLWVRDDKDSLALGNVTGAMAFQATVPVAFGLAFTEWDLDPPALAAGVAGVLGGALALFAIRRRSFGAVTVAGWTVLLLGFFAFVAFMPSGPPAGGPPPGAPPPGPPPPPGAGAPPPAPVPVAPPPG